MKSGKNHIRNYLLYKDFNGMQAMLTTITKKDQIDYLIKFLENERQFFGPWIHRKEIAAWSAVVLYLSGLLVVSGYIFKNVDSRTLALNILFPLSITFGMLILAYFVFLQFGSIFDAMQMQSSLTYWSTKIIGKMKIPHSFYFENNTSINPISINIIQRIINGALVDDKKRKNFFDDFKDYPRKEIPNLRPATRQKNIFQRLLLPITHLYKKDKKIANIEREEATIYHLFIWPTILVILYYFLIFDC